MNILFLAPRLPFPADTGGKIRTWNILKQVARFASVRLVCFSFDPEDKNYIPEIEKQGIKVTLVPCPQVNFWQKVKVVLFHPHPYSITKYNTELMRQAIVTLLAQEKFDLVHIDHLHMAHYIKLIKETRGSGSPVTSHQSPVVDTQLPSTVYLLPSLLDNHNVEYKILERGGKVEPRWWKKLIYIQQAAKTKNFERLAINKFNVVTAVSDDDANVLRELSGGTVNVEVLPNGVDTDFFQPSAGKNPSPVTSHRSPAVTRCLGDQVSSTPDDSVVFTGSMDWLPNDDAVRYFINEILPLIWQKNPDIKFYIVGKSPSGALQQLSKSINLRLDGLTTDSSGPLGCVILTGRVEDVRQYMSCAKVFVVPLRIGGGTRLKILEAMSFGIPVVSTSIGAEGIAYTNDKDIVIADEPQVFADAVLALLKDEGKRARLSVAGRRLVMEKYDWGIIGKKLNGIYGKMLAS